MHLASFLFAWLTLNCFSQAMHVHRMILVTYRSILEIMQKNSSDFPSASFMRRIFSMVYEALLLAAVLFLASFIFISLTHDTQSDLMKPIFRGYLLMVCGIYFVWFWVNGGQTLAMKTWRLRLISKNNSALTIKQAVLRFISAFLGISFFGIGLLWALFDADKQFLHDRIAGTRIIQM